MAYIYRCLILALVGYLSPSSEKQSADGSSAFDQSDFAVFIAIQKYFCSDTKFCPEHETGNLTEHLSRLPVQPPLDPSSSCCSTCSCQMDCVLTGNCCPEMIEHMANVSTETVCVQPQIRLPDPDYKNSRDSFFMISGCSIGRDNLQFSEPIRQKCEYADKFQDFEVKVPVTDIWSNDTYINRYCAICNDVAEEDLTYWVPELTCDSDYVADVSIETIVEEVSKTKTCNIIMKVPDSATLSVTRCSTYISSCNVSGNVAHYDPFIEKACRSYTHIYDYTYNNVFCYMCNTNDAVGKASCSRHNIGNLVPTEVSFSALLRFKPGETSNDPGNPDGSSECGPLQVYDVYKEVCRNVTCYPPRVLQGDACNNPYESVTGGSYRFFLKLKSVEITKPSDLLPIDDKMYVDLLGASMSQLWQYTTFRSFIREKDNDKSTTTLDYYLVQIDVDIPVHTYVKQSIIEQLIKLHHHEEKRIHKRTGVISFRAAFIMANLVRVDRETVYDSVRDEILTEAHPDRPKPPAEDYEIPMPVWDLNDTDTRTHDYEEDDEKGEEDDEKGTDTSSDSHFEVVIPPMFCPLIALPHEEFNLSWHSGGVYVKTLETNISRNNYIHINDIASNNTIFICKSFFLNVTEFLLLRYLKGGTQQAHGAQGLLTLVCTCFSVSCSILTLITYILFKELRTQPGINNMMLTSSLTCAQLLFQFGIGLAKSVEPWACQLLGALIHFSWLLTLMWMNVCSLHMFRVFRSLTKIAGNANILKTTLAYTSYCFIVAVTPVVINITLSNGEIGYGGDLCYITSYAMNLYLFLLPVGLIVVFNITLFIGVIITISKMPKIDGNVSKNRNFAKIYIKISSITGMTWLFGFLFAFTGVEIFDYIFIISNAGLGVFIFLSFICNKRVLTLYGRARKQNKAKYAERTQTFSETQTETNTVESR